MRSDEDMIQADLAEEVLESCLNDLDLEVVTDVFKDVNSRFRWGRIISTIAETMEENIGDLLDGGPEFPGITYLKGNAWELVSDQDREDFDDAAPRSPARNRMLTLLLIKKLLMVWKTKVNQELSEIPIITADEELDLWDIVTGVDEDDEDTKEALVVPVRKIEAGIESTQSDCSHARSSMKARETGGVNWWDWYCKDCKRVFRSVMSQGQSQKKRGSANPKVCQHPSIGWRDDAVGEIATCLSCKEQIDHPETYRWIQAGLEPPGDDPTQDEVTILCSNY